MAMGDDMSRVTVFVAVLDNSPRRMLRGRGARDLPRADRHNANAQVFTRNRDAYDLSTMSRPPRADRALHFEMCAIKHKQNIMRMDGGKATGRGRAKGGHYMSNAHKNVTCACARRNESEKHSNNLVCREEEKRGRGLRVPTRNRLSGMLDAIGSVFTQRRSARMNERKVAKHLPNHAARSIAAQRQSAHAKHAQLACEKNVTRHATKYAAVPQ